ncbi:hypothetical protein [Pseudomonas grimontii]|uniref:hypothetical protein n=1 Tax=Pseudomonas grimontii TaxID=129847 RepID=UPI00387B611F
MNKTLKAFAVVGYGYEDSPEQLPVAATDGVQLAVFATIPSATERLEFKGEQVLPVVILSEKDHDARNAKYEQLQQCLTAADERADDLSSAATKALEVLRSLLKMNACGMHYAAAQMACHQLSAALKSGNS